jgi:hypothetical protein
MISVVSFHHKKGPIIEFAYPENYADCLKVEKGKLEEKITYYGMPDAVHNKDEDCIYFNMFLDCEGEGGSFMVFGVSYFK